MKVVYNSLRFDHTIVIWRHASLAFLNLNSCSKHLPYLTNDIVTVVTYTNYGTILISDSSENIPSSAKCISGLFLPCLQTDSFMLLHLKKITEMLREYMSLPQVLNGTLFSAQEKGYTM